MRATPAHIAQVIRAHYADDYRRAFGRDVPLDDRTAMEDTGKALAVFQETLLSGRTPFDDFRDALERGDAAARYPEEAQRGLALFVGKGNCSVCHAGRRFTSEARVAGIRIPALREVARTAPYMHDGRQATLRDALRGHGPVLTRLETSDLVAFLESLSEMTRAVVRKEQAGRDVRP
jgi:cytochrome c peroxidase